ncbi:hypothetical protein HY628_02215 [Candidatus Uhrbacteria bacterium]|nr:hypothetical protein [Candidatus Uhrbacteria bacterium]
MRPHLYILAFGALLIGFNQYQLAELSHELGASRGWLPFLSVAEGRVDTSRGPATVADLVTPRGQPFYGVSLNVSYDQVVQGLDILAKLDPGYGSAPVNLNDQQKNRYIAIGAKPTIACEFCCGATTLVFSDGRPACGCQHSQAMRGLLAYLIVNYPQTSDDEIMRELARWKSLFFPKQMTERAAEQLASGQFTADIASLTYGLSAETLKKLGAAGAVAAPSSIQTTDMVGGC